MPQEMLENINTLGGSTRNNEYYNHGCGAKIAGLAHNRAGIIYRSWKNGQGYMMKFMRNQMGRYGAVKMQGRNSFEISDEMKPSAIQNNGCVVTLLGDNDKENTTIPSDKYGFLKGSRVSKSEWLTCYLNTKFYSVPNNIKITASRFAEDKNKVYIINYCQTEYSWEDYVEQLITQGFPYPIDKVSKEIYKRLFHNMAYLTKKKGTISGLRQLINICSSARDN